MGVQDTFELRRIELLETPPDQIILEENGRDLAALGRRVVDTGP